MCSLQFSGFNSCFNDSCFNFPTIIPPKIVSPTICITPPTIISNQYSTVVENECCESDHCGVKISNALRNSKH